MLENQTTPKPFVFVLMPFDPNFNDVYQLGIKAACHDAGGYSERVDEQNYEGSIVERIYNQIAKADLIVADMTGRNPNVFYEVGYAHALGKSVVLLTQRSEDIPFDLKHYPHIVYGGSITQLKEDLRKRVKWTFDNPKNVAKFANEHIEILTNDVDILKAPTIECPIQSGFYFVVMFDFHNSTEKSIEFAQFQVGFVCEKNALTECKAYMRQHLHEENRYDQKAYNQPNGKKLFVVNQIFELLPGSWEKLYVVFNRTGNLTIGEVCSLTLQMFSGQGFREFPFKVKAVQDSRSR